MQWLKKHLSRGRICKVETELIFGTGEELKISLKSSKVSKKVNTSFIERQNGTDRNRNSRKIRRSLSFSKELEEHEAMTFFCLYCYNFCWPVLTLQIQD
jgi:deferrochelatase/peroxidase EfeB